MALPDYEDFDAAVAATPQDWYDMAFLSYVMCPCQAAGGIQEIAGMVERAAWAAGYETRRIQVISAEPELKDKPDVPLPADTIGEPQRRKLGDMTVSEAIRAAWRAVCGASWWLA